MPTKIVALGVVLAALVIGGGKLNSHRIELKLRDLQADCHAEARQEDAMSPKSTGGHWETICDPEELEDLSLKETVGIQAQQLTALRELQASESWPIPTAIGVLFFSALPWVWYFLLRRIRELHDAITGK